MRPQAHVSVTVKSLHELSTLTGIRAARRETRKQLDNVNRQVKRLEQRFERAERQEQELMVEQVESFKLGSAAKNRVVEAIEMTRGERQEIDAELRHQRQLAQAIVDELQVIDRAEGHLYYNQGIDYHERGDYGRAAKFYRKADALASGDTDVTVNMAAAYIAEGEHRRAADALERVLELTPDLPEALLNLGMLYDDYLDNEKRALSYYRLYMKAAPNAPDAEQVHSWEQEARQVLEQSSW